MTGVSTSALWSLPIAQGRARAPIDVKAVGRARHGEGFATAAISLREWQSVFRIRGLHLRGQRMRLRSIRMLEARARPRARWCFQRSGMAMSVVPMSLASISKMRLVIQDPVAEGRREKSPTEHQRVCPFRPTAAPVTCCLNASIGERKVVQAMLPTPPDQPMLPIPPLMPD